jgi:hypothetical protein
LPRINTLISWPEHQRGIKIITLPPAHCQKETQPIVEVLLGVHDFAIKNDPGMTFSCSFATGIMTKDCKVFIAFLGFL